MYPKSQIRRCIKECNELLEICKFNKQPVKYKHCIQHFLASVCLHITHDCNLRCEYCYADAGSYGGERSLMGKEVMTKAIDFAFTHSGKFKEINIGFFGGEPLLNFKRIYEAVQYAKEQAKRINKRVTFSMTSNAVLLNPKIMDFLNQEGFSLIFSIDGPKKIHDKMRKTKNGGFTHSIVLRNLKKFRKKYSDNFTVRGTFTRTTSNFSQQVLFLNDQGFKHVSVEPAQLDEKHPHAISHNGAISRILYEYDQLAEIYLERFNQNNPLHFFHFDQNLRNLLHPVPKYTECGAGGGFVSVIPDGRIFPCFETVPEEKNCIGHVDSGFDKQKRRQFQRMYVDVKRECRKCWIRYHCGGGCHAFNIRYNNNITIPYKPQCVFIKYRFKLAAWILSEIAAQGDKSIKKLKTHLEIT
ncbi:MAG: SPASM domain-containing protein [Deltaproteobacteria bacterium]|nr:SPASM domain-containing protein [Deltaproteobacteria bacterium]